MIRHAKSLLIAASLLVAGGVASADGYRGAPIYGSGTTVNSYGYGHARGPNYVIPSQTSPTYQGGYAHVQPRRFDFVRPRNLQPRRGYTWIDGRRELRNGRLAYVRGHWQRVLPRRGYVWIEDHVEYRDGYATYVPGHWQIVATARWSWR